MNASANRVQGAHQNQAEHTVTVDLTAKSASAVSFWNESQILAVVRHAGATGRSPQEFFNNKWKKMMFHQK
jgi:hypothetical protein